ncbi:hypothetical protein IWX49DRAFT_391046 [Phyllosticta citricarpa]
MCRGGCFVGLVGLVGGGCGGLAAGVRFSDRGSPSVQPISSQPTGQLPTTSLCAGRTWGNSGSSKGMERCYSEEGRKGICHFLHLVCLCIRVSSIPSSFELHPIVISGVLNSLTQAGNTRNLRIFEKKVGFVVME